MSGASEGRAAPIGGVSRFTRRIATARTCLAGPCTARARLVRARLARAGAALAAASCWLQACSLASVSEVPLRGPAPCVVLVLPVVGAVEESAAHALLATADDALAARGYYPVPVEVGAALLESHGLSVREPRPAAAYAEVARQLGADAFLVVRAARWDAVWAPDLAAIAALDYDVGYQLWSAAGAALLWEQHHAGRWSSADQPQFIDHDTVLADFEGEPRQRGTSLPYADHYDAAQALHGAALARLPRGPLP